MALVFFVEGKRSYLFSIISPAVYKESAGLVCWDGYLQAQACTINGKLIQFLFS